MKPNNTVEINIDESAERKKMEKMRHILDDIDTLKHMAQAFTLVINGDPRFNTSEKQNYFSDMEINCKIWTGSDTSSKRIRVSSDELVRELAKVMIPRAKEMIAELKTELHSIIYGQIEEKAL